MSRQRLTARRAQVLAVIADTGSAYFGEIVDATGMPPGRCAIAVAALVERGLVEFVEHDVDLGNLYATNDNGSN